MPYISTYDRLVRAEGLEEGLSLGLKEGLKEGLQKGRQEGRQEGRLTVLRETIEEALLERFGLTFESVRPRLESIEDEAALRQLVKRVWTVRSMAEFEREFLSAVPPRSPGSA